MSLVAQLEDYQYHVRDRLGRVEGRILQLEDEVQSALESFSGLSERLDRMEKILAKALPILLSREFMTEKNELLYEAVSEWARSESLPFPASQGTSEEPR